MATKDIWILDFIGHGFFEDGVTAKSVRDDLAKVAKSDRLLVHINSPGGNVFEGVSIRALLASHPGGVDVSVEGLAASAASFIATVGEQVTMAEGAMLMVHDPWTIAIGNAAEMQKAAETLDKIAESLVGAYARKSGKSAEEIRAVMRAETWMTADEAVKFGLADSKSDVAAAAYVIPASFGFKNPPQPAAAAKQRPTNRLAILERQLELIRAAIGQAA